MECGLTPADVRTRLTRALRLDLRMARRATRMEPSVSPFLRPSCEADPDRSSTAAVVVK